MKKYVRYILTAAAVLTAPGLAPLYAQTTDTVTRVPFGFTVGTASLPGDTYRLEKAAGHTDVFLIRSLHRGAIILGQPADARLAVGCGVVVVIARGGQRAGYEEQGEQSGLHRNASPSSG